MVSDRGLGPLLPAYNLERASECHEALRALILEHPGGREDQETLRRVRRWCREALDATADDPVCSKAVGAIEKYAATLFSADGHVRWERPGLSGSAQLKLLTLRALIDYRSRLSRLRSVHESAAWSRRAFPSDKPN